MLRFGVLWFSGLAVLLATTLHRLAPELGVSDWFRAGILFAAMAAVSVVLAKPLKHFRPRSMDDDRAGMLALAVASLIILAAVVLLGVHARGQIARALGWSISTVHGGP